MSNSHAIAREIKRFEFVSQNIWPLIRPMLGNFIAKRCHQCTISSNAPHVTIEGNICQRCEAFNHSTPDDKQSRWEEKYIANEQKKLHEILTEYQGKGKRRYDALVLFSGGKDSTYMLYRIKRDYPKLRMLTLTIDNGFYSVVALETSQQVAKKLDLDHIVYKPTSSLYASLYRYTLLHVDESGSYGTVDRLDGSLNQHMGLRYAAEFEIPLMISGVDWAQALLMGSNTTFEHPRHDLLTRVDTDRIERRSKFKIAEIFNKEDAEMYWDGTKWPAERVPRWILPLMAWRPDKQLVADELERMHLILPGHSSPLVTNNEVLSIMTAIDIKKIGHCSFEPEFSDMIRIKRTDGTYWRNVFECVEFLVKKNLFMNKTFIELLQRLNLKREDIGL